MRPYIGRYAPSPTGRLHDGNLITAALAWADARSQGGQFLLRMEDLDRPRVVPNSAKRIIEDLEALGLDWDGGIMYQSQRQMRYEEVLTTLLGRNLAYPCRCSRKDIKLAASAPHGPEGPIYPGTCCDKGRDALLAELAPGRELAYRLRLPPSLPPESVFDRRLGAFASDLKKEVGDFILRRADGIFAYQLACVVDDIDQGITQIVRGEDLITSVARQQYLWSLMGHQPPRWLHLPLLTDQAGAKLSKRLRKWDDTPIDGPKKLGEFALHLGWIDLWRPLTAPEFLSLYTQHPFTKGESNP